MHRTCSIDFSICVLGVAKMELDGGEMLTLKSGMSVCAVGPPLQPSAVLVPFFFLLRALATDAVGVGAVTGPCCSARYCASPV